MASLEGPFFLYLYLFAVGVILLLGLLFYFLKRRYGNVLFLSEGKVELDETRSVVIKKVLPFLGEGYLIFVEIRTEKGRHFEVWGYSKSSGFRRISKIGDPSDG